jgi:hypothetical protein
MIKPRDVEGAVSQEEENELIANSERGEWVSVGNIEERRAYWEQDAQNTLARPNRSEKRTK